MTRLVTVSNRVQMPGRQRASGGLAAGLDGALRGRGGLWFGWSGAVVDGAAPGRVDLSRAQGVTHATVAMSREEYRGAYLGFSNSALWPALHGFTGEIACRAWDFAAYRRFNQRFAQLLQPLLRADDLVWVHDYQLAPLGRCLRRLGATQPLGFFRHTPFPSEAALRALPVARQWLANLLAYDVVGLQTEADLAAFHAALRASGLGAADGAQGVVGARGRRVLSGAFPVGVVTPLRDGMNLVAKEFVAAQSPADPGALVLSAHAGAARELDGALQVEPQDPDSVAAAIGQALRMSRAERRERHGAMLSALLANDASAWSERLVSRLASAHHA